VYIFVAEKALACPGVVVTYTSVGTVHMAQISRLSFMGGAGSDYTGAVCLICNSSRVVSARTVPYTQYNTI